MASRRQAEFDVTNAWTWTIFECSSSEFDVLCRFFASSYLTTASELLNIFKNGIQGSPSEFWWSEKVLPGFGGQAEHHAIES